MRPRTLTAIAAVGLALAAPAAFAAQSTRLGTGSKTCTAKRGASCRGVKHHHADLHGRDLRRAHFEKADLHHSDFHGADLRGAHFEGATLHHVDFRGAKLRGAHFEAPKGAGKRANNAGSAPPCLPDCAGANLTAAHLENTDLAGANFSYAWLNSAWLDNANFTGANLSMAGLAMTTGNYVNFAGANLTNATLDGAFLSYPNFTNANLTEAWLAAELDYANFTGATFSGTTCPDGTVTNTGC